MVEKIERSIKEIEQSGLYGNQVHQETLECALEALKEIYKIKTQKVSKKSLEHE